MKKSKINKINEGNLFRLVDSPTAEEYVRGGYEKKERKYLCWQNGKVEKKKLLEANRTIYI